MRRPGQPLCQDPWGYEHYDSRPRRLKHSPLTHTVPSQRVHPCLDVSPVPRCPGYTFGYTPRRPPPRPQSMSNVSAAPNHLAVMRWLYIYRSTTGHRSLMEPTALPDVCMAPLEGRT